MTAEPTPDTREKVASLSGLEFGGAFLRPPSRSAAPAEDAPVAQPSTGAPTPLPDAGRPKEPRPRRPREALSEPRVIAAPGSGTSVLANVAADVADQFKARSLEPGRSQAVLLGDAVQFASAEDVLRYTNLQPAQPGGVPGVRRISIPRDPVALQIRVRPDQRAWLEAHKPQELAHVPMSRWLGACITLYMKEHAPSAAASPRRA